MQSVNFTLSNFDNIEKSKDTFDEKMVEPLLTLFRDKFKVDACFIALVVEDTYELVIGKNSVISEAEQFVRIYHLGKEGYEQLFKNYDEDLICDHANSVLNGESILHYGVFRDDGTLDGIVGFADFHNKNRVWTKDEKSALSKLGKTLRLAVLYEKLRIQSKEQISRLRNEFKDQINIITSATSDYSSIFLIDYDTLVQTVYYTNGRYKAILDISSRELYYPKSAQLAVYASVYKDDRKRVLEAVEINNVKARLAADGYYTVNFRRYVDDELDFAAYKYSLIELSNKKYIVLSIKEVTDCTKVPDELTDYDELTGLFTKDEFQKRCEEKIALSKDVSNLYMIAFDVDNITKYNAYFGMATGNVLLKHIASILKTLSENLDVIYCRLGADRFAIFADAEFKKVEELIINIKSNIKLFNPKFFINLAFGISTVEDKQTPIIAILERAISASKNCKYKYEPAYSVYTKTINKKRVFDIYIIEHMEEALKNNKILPYYQPVFDIANNEVVSFEELVRWDADKTIFEANKFIEVFNITKYVYKMDVKIWEDCIKLLKRQIVKGGKVYPISLNICDDYIYYNELPETLNKLIKRHSVMPELIFLEINEKALLKNSSSPEIIKKLKDIGFRITLDNLTASISLLNEDLFDRIKIDLLNFDLNKKNSKIILKNIFNLSNELKIDLVATKVEDEKTYNFLKENGVKYIQGYYLAKPMSEEKVFEEFNL